MEQFNYNGVTYNVYARREIGNKYECIKDESGNNVYGAQTHMIKAFLDANHIAYDAKKLTHPLIRLALGNMSKPGIIKDITGVDIKTLLNTKDIDFESISDCLNRYAGGKYRKEDTTQKEAWQNAASELTDFAKAMVKGTDLTVSKGQSWQNSGEVARHLWLEFKDPEHQDEPYSISLFVTKEASGTISYEIKLEAKDRECKTDEYDLFNLHLDYSSGQPEDCYFEIFEKKDLIKIVNNRKDAKDELSNSNKITKIRTVIKLNPPFDKSQTTRLIGEAIDAVETLLPEYSSIFSGSGPISSTIAATKKTNPLNIILFGPPGTGKTYNSRTLAVDICDPTAGPILGNYDEVLKRYNDLVKKGRIVFTTFHQSYGYEEFIEGIRAKTNPSGDVYYEVEDGLFKKLCVKANKHCVERNPLAKKDDGDEYASEEEKLPYVIIVDEINRGNISKIFGELITLIEPSKRFGAKEEIKATLPYSGDKFSVPSNVYIIGTMNTADRSIALMDTALRRRFDFIEMMPEESVISQDVVDGIEIKTMLSVINQRIEALFDREHTIGHAFFTGLNASSTVDDVALIFENKIIPLLQEYFYEDYEKIRYVLADNAKANEDDCFIKRIKINNSTLFKGSVDVEDNKYRYEINKAAFKNPQNYKDIY